MQVQAQRLLVLQMRGVQRAMQRIARRRRLQCHQNECRSLDAALPCIAVCHIGVIAPLAVDLEDLHAQYCTHARVILPCP